MVRVKSLLMVRILGFWGSKIEIAFPEKRVMSWIQKEKDLLSDLKISRVLTRGSLANRWFHRYNHLRTVISIKRFSPFARVAEQADAADSKSADLTVIGVRFPSRVPSFLAIVHVSNSYTKMIHITFSNNSPTLTSHSGEEGE